ncbi:MAG: VWA domain-containing protein [Planctomycetes bacterium]|nr:VWA domain-containing protein [Planctomycetota bacterium]
MQFREPAAFILLLAALAAAWWALRRRSAAPGSAGSLVPVASAARARGFDRWAPFLALALLFAGAAQPVTVGGAAPRRLILLRDRSASVRDLSADDEALRRWLMSPAFFAADRVTVIDFAAQPREVHDDLVPGAAPPLPEQSGVDVGGTDLAPALDAAAGRAARARAAGEAVDVLLLTDGRDPQPARARAAAARAGREAPVSVVPLATLDADPAVVAAFEVDAAALAGQPMRLAVVIEGEPGRAARVRVYEPKARGPDALDRAETITFPPDGRLRVTFSRAAAPGARLYRAELDVPAGDPEPANNVATAACRVRPAGRVAHVVAPGALPLPSAALGVPGAVDQRSAADPGWAARAASYDVTILDDLPISVLDDAAVALLVSAVRDAGARLIVAGGARSLGPGGYAGTRFETALMPLLADPADRDAAFALALDNSGSMEGAKWRMAERAAARFLLGRGRRDRVRLSGFRAAPALPAGPAFLGREGDQALLDGLARLSSAQSGGTNIAAAANDAVEALAAEPADTRHLLLLTDGLDADPATLAQRLLPIGRRCGEMGVSVTVITTGGGAEPLAALTAAGAAGRVIEATPERLPSLFAEGLDRAKGYVVDEPTPVTTGPEWPASIPGNTTARDGGAAPGDGLPPLDRMVRTRLAPGARLALNTPRGPALATRRVGLGRVAAFAFRPGVAEWSGAFAADPAAAASLSEFLRAFTAPGDAGSFDLEFFSGPDGAPAVRARLLNDLPARLPSALSLRLIGPNQGDDSPLAVPAVTLRRQGANRWEGALAAPPHEAGRWMLSADPGAGLDAAGGVAQPGERATAADDPGGADAVVAAGEYRLPMRGEYLPGPVDRDLIRHLAAGGGGRVFASLESFAPQARVARGRDLELAPWLLGLAALVILIDTALTLWRR